MTVTTPPCRTVDNNRHHSKQGIMLRQKKKRGMAIGPSPIGLGFVVML